MDALITGEGDGIIGLSVIDNNDVEHLIEMDKVGNITGHQQDGYPDDSVKRTNEEAEHVNQARRYARWYVYRERGYDTVPPADNPDRILAASLGLATLSDAPFRESFDDLIDQLESHADDTPVVLPFDDVDADSDVLVYEKDIWVTPDPTEFEPPVLEQFLGSLSGESDSPVIPPKAEFDAQEFDDLDFEIEAVSGLHYRHNDGRGTERTHRGDRPRERDPDATIELIAFDPAEINTFQHYFVSHLFYQVRDCFLRMGQKPPVAFRAQGQGKYRATLDHRFCSLYENYHDPKATITSWQPGPTEE